MELDFALAGMAEVSCDRCLDPLKLDIELETKMYVHFGNHVSEGDEDDSDVMVLSHDEEQLDIAQFIYEYAHLSLPARRVHPDDKTGKSTCNEYMIQKLNQYLVEEDKGSPASDPRWNNLKNVFDNIKS